MWPFNRKKTETRAAASGFTAEIIAARETYVSGARGIAELTATAQTCIGLWEAGLALADVEGTELLDRRTLALAGRSVALRGEAVFLIDGDGLVPCADWDLTTRNGRPRAYRLSISESGGGRTLTALAGEVLHLRIGCDPAAPYYGTAPLKRASLTAGLLNAVETALAETFETAPLGSQIVPLPDSGADDMANLRDAFRGKRGSVLVIEGIAQATAAGMNPQLGQRREDLSPNLKDAMTDETLTAARDAIGAAFGVLPSMLNRSATGPAIREGQRHLAQWQLQPVAALLAEEATDKLGSTVSIDVMRPVQAFDTGGRARAMSAIISALAQAKEAGIDPGTALNLVDWKEQ
ncbi:Tryptophan synthase beta chain [Rhodovulum sp. P5]|uniref:phage portal protein n=1 Tax=Rhodovulum sp. P5 TaxID=1564506 RepID=UPI0009C2D8E3|nr:phage portal protein [Rhodovulum sp. P5]ARE38327.1 Tryptophan synthase beta chain [Rhodovulum sp. P5]